jgi:multidrug resistance efflux pump
MELLMILTYTAICYAIFKIFKIPVNKWSIPTAALGGIILIALILLIMNYNHPFTRQARLYFYTTPIVPVVRGEVIEVPVKPNVPLKRGDVLFRIDPRHYQYVVEQKRAALAEAEQNVHQLKAALDVALANVHEATASRDRAKQSFERYETGNANARETGRAQPFPEIQVENQRGVYLASEGALLSAQASAEQARLAYESQINGVNTTVARLQAELRDAEYDLEETVVTAPTDGYVTQLFLRPGMIAVPMPLRPVIVFIHSEDNIFAAAFQQNALQRVRAGDEAEVAFDAIPGRVFKGEVAGIMDAVVEGQLQPTGTLIDPESRQEPGRALAQIMITEDLTAYQLPAGSSAQVAVYTEHWHHFAIIRRILLRMKSWMNYVFTEGH